MGAMRVMETAPRFGGEVLAPGGPSPAHGEHTGVVLAGLKLTAAQM